VNKIVKITNNHGGGLAFEFVYEHLKKHKDNIIKASPVEPLTMLMVQADILGVLCRLELYDRIMDIQDEFFDRLQKIPDPVTRKKTMYNILSEMYNAFPSTLPGVKEKPVLCSCLELLVSRCRQCIQWYESQLASSDLTLCSSVEIKESEEHTSKLVGIIIDICMYITHRLQAKWH